MANIVKHKFVSGIPDGADSTQVRPSNWNDEHAFAGGSHNQLLKRDTGATDGVSWTDILSALVVRFLLTTPASPQNGDIWIEMAGTSPSRTITLYIRDGVTTRVFHQITV
jgi:hypothetical protein